MVFTYIRCYAKLNSIIKSFLCIIIPDCLLVLNFLPMTIYTSLREDTPTPSSGGGGWCIFSAYLATVVMVALNLGTVCVAFTTWRLTCLRPVPDKVIWAWNAASWLVGIICASLFLINDDLGDYKGLYCCIKQDSYQTYAVLPAFLIVIVSLVPTFTFFMWAFARVKKVEMMPDGRIRARIKASRTILECGLWLITFSYGCWVIIYVIGGITLAGG